MLGQRSLFPVCARRAYLNARLCDPRCWRFLADLRSINRRACGWRTGVKTASMAVSDEAVTCCYVLACCMRGLLVACGRLRILVVKLSPALSPTHQPTNQPASQPTTSQPQQTTSKRYQPQASTASSDKQLQRTTSSRNRNTSNRKHSQHKQPRATASNRK